MAKRKEPEPSVTDIAANKSVLAELNAAAASQDQAGIAVAIAKLEESGYTASRIKVIKEQYGLNYRPEGDLVLRQAMPTFDRGLELPFLSADSAP